MMREGSRYSIVFYFSLPETLSLTTEGFGGTGTAALLPNQIVDADHS